MPPGLVIIVAVLMALAVQLIRLRLPVPAAGRRAKSLAWRPRIRRIPHAAAAGAPPPIPAGPAFAAAQRWPRTRPARRYRRRGMAAMLAERTRCAPRPAAALASTGVDVHHAACAADLIGGR